MNCPDFQSEVDLIEAVYCRENEFRRLCSTAFELSLSANTTLAVHHSDVTNTVAVSLSSTEISRQQCDRIKLDLEEYLKILQSSDPSDGPTLLDFCSFALKQFAEFLSFHEPSSKSETDDACNSSTRGSESLKRLILRFDHMRDRSGYLSKLRDFSETLSVHAEIYFIGKSNKKKKNREEIRCLLEGRSKDVSEWLRLVRTTCMDVDGQGRPCRERLMAVLHEEETAENGRAIAPSSPSLAIFDLPSKDDLLRRLHSALHVNAAPFCL